MRRLFLYLLVAMLVFTALRATHGPRERFAPPPAHWQEAARAREDAARHRRELTAKAKRQAEQAAAEARRALQEAGREIHQAYREARDELGRAYREARDEIREAYRQAVADGDGPRPLPPPPPPPAPRVAPALEEAEGLPVPIVPGTRVTEAEAKPPVRPARPFPARFASRAAQPVPRVQGAGTVAATPSPAPAPVAPAVAEAPMPFVGDICATEDRARADAYKVFRAGVARWLTPDVPASWTPPEGMLDALLVGSKVDPYISKTETEDGVLHIATLTADLSPRHRAELVAVYDRELVRHRLITLGGALGFVLICLAAISGYIRADEATKGYYTNRLRMLAAAGVGAAGVIVYKMVA
jgi:hypothetical protein